MRNSSIASLSRIGCLGLAAANSALEPAQAATCYLRRSLSPALRGMVRVTTIRLVAGHLGVRPAGGVDGPGHQVGLRDPHRQSAARLVTANRLSHDLVVHAAVRLPGWPGRLVAGPHAPAALPARVTEPLR